MPDLLCHECGHEAQTEDLGEASHCCPVCDSDFCEIMSTVRQVTPDPSADEPQLPQQPSQPQQSQNPQSYQQSSLERDGGAGDDSAPNTMRHTTRFSMPNGHSYEVNFTTHVFQPGADFLAGLSPAGTTVHPNPTGSQTFMVFGNSGSGVVPNDTVASLLSNIGSNPGNSARYSPADFGMGQSLDSLLAQLAELHQTREQPTSVAFRESLPRLKVPARGVESAVSSAPTMTENKSRAEEDLVAPSLAAADQSSAGEDASSTALAAAGKMQGMASCREGDTCCVCRNEFAAGSEVVQLPCDHCFDEDCIMPWLEMNSTCPVCRRKLPHEESASSEEPLETATAAESVSVSLRRTRSITRSAAQDAQPATGRSERRTGSNEPLQADNSARTSNSGAEGANVNMATAVMQQLAALVTGQMGQMGFAVPPHLTQQQQQQPSPHDQMPQMRLQMRIPFSAQAQRAAHAHSDAQEQAAAAVSARRLERRNIEQQVAELRRLQALHQQLQGPATAAQCQQQLTQLRRLGATLQERLALVDTSYAAGNCQRLRLQSQVRATREQVAMLRRVHENNDLPQDGERRSDPSALQAAVVCLLAFEDSLATAAGQLNVCRQSRQGLQENQRLINHHIAIFDRAFAQQGPQGMTCSDPSAQPVVRQSSGALAAAGAVSPSSSETAVNGDVGSSQASATRPASSPAEGDGSDLLNCRRVRARTNERQSGPVAASLPSLAFMPGHSPAAAYPIQLHLRAVGHAAEQSGGPLADTEMIPVSPGRKNSVEGGWQHSSGTVRPLHSTGPTSTQYPAVAAARVSQGFPLPLQAVPGALGRLFGGLRGMFTRR